MGVAMLAGAAGAHAQTITTAAVAVPAAAAPVPADGAWMLALLACALAAAAAWAFRSGHAGRVLRCACTLTVLGCGVMAAGYNSSVRAQLAPWMLSFTQAAGETLNIPLLPDPAAGTPTDFRPVVFSNATGGRLRVAGLTGPAGPASCFPSGVPASLPATPLPAGATACAVDLPLEPGAACAVDVAAMCAQAVATVPPAPTLAQVSHPRCDASGKFFVLLEGTGLASVSSVRFSGTAAISVQVLGDTQVLAELPSPWNGGQADVSLTTGYGTAAFTKTFDPTLGELLCAQGDEVGTYQVFRPVATAQDNSTTPICVLCSVLNASLAVDMNYDNYSQLLVPLGAGNGSVQQVLISPWTHPSSVRAGVVVGFPSQVPEGVLPAMRLTTFWGTLSNGNTQQPELRLLPGYSDRYLLTLPAGANFDRIEAKVMAGVTNALSRVHVYAGVVQASP